MSIDLHAHLRRIKPHRHLAQLTARSDGALVSAAALAGQTRAILVPDTNVYIRDVAGTLPPATATLVDRGLLFHSAVCLAELSTGVANADPTHPRWKQVRDYYAGLIARIPPGRVLTPDAEVWTQAGLIAGTLARTQGYGRHQRKECLNDALIFLCAAKAGMSVLTSDREDFDFIQQLAPWGRFVYI